MDINYCLAVGVLLCVSLGACAPVPVIREPLPETRVVEQEKPIHNGSIYQRDTSRFLFEDLKARRVGDLITIILDEKTVAAKSASTSSSKDTALNMPAPTLLGNASTLAGNPLSTSVTSGTAFSGSGDSTQSNSLSGNITVSVVSIHSNGNMLVKGEKMLTLNNGRELVSISGIVRPKDVTPENTVVSTLIANANIVYSGKGLIADSNKAGWLTRILNSPFWPL